MTASPEASTVDIMHSADWPQVRSIYAQGIATGQATFEDRVVKITDED